METIQIQNLTVEELREIINETVKRQIEPLLPKDKQKVYYLTRKETAELLGISLVTLHNWTKKGLIKGHRINTRIRYKSSEVENAFVELQSILRKRF